ncbi:hypothetical protein D9M70_584080 [compost metagenome]
MAYVHAGYLCKVVDLDDPNLILHLADPESKAKACLKKLVGKKLLSSLEVSLEALNDARNADSG